MKRSKQECDLKSCFLCQYCLPEWIPAVNTHRKNFDVKKGEVIFEEGTPVSGVCFVYEGNVKVHKNWGINKELIVRFATRRAIFGHRGLISPTYPISATALENCRVCFFELGFFNTSLKVNQELAYQMLLFLSRDLLESEKRMRNLAHMSVKGRLAQSLLSLEEQFGKDESGAIQIDLSRQDLASYIGATYETVFRSLNELGLENLITAHGKRIILLEPEKLLKFTQENNQEI